MEYLYKIYLWSSNIFLVRQSHCAIFNFPFQIQNGAIRRDGTPDVFWFVVSGLQSVINRHGANSAPTEKAESLLREALANVNDAFRASYNDQVVIATITTDAGHIRRTREASPKADAPASDLNLSKSYSSDYAVIFNIILWFSVAFTFAIIATAIAIGTMDPGRDSIIYRMTSNRMKKEN
jgi:renin receptor